MSKRLSIKLLLRRDTEANLQNVILANGEPGYATDAPKLKIGDGVRTWAELPAINRDPNGCVIEVRQYSVAAESGTTPPDSSANWVENSYPVGSQATPWIWVKYVYKCDNGETIILYHRSYDSSWQEFGFEGTPTTITTTFNCTVDTNKLVIGSINDTQGQVETTGSYTPSGSITISDGQ